MNDNCGINEEKSSAYADQSVITYMPFRLYTGLFFVITGLSVYFSTI